MQELPRYAQKYNDIYNKIVSLPSDQYDQLNKATWDLAVFSHAVANKRFTSAQRYLEATHATLSKIPPFSAYANALIKQFARFLKRPITSRRR